MGWFSDMIDANREVRPIEGDRQPTLASPYAPGGYQTSATGDGQMTDAQYLDAIRQAQMTGYGMVRPGQEQYYLDRRHSGDTSDWATGEPGRTMDDYWIARATGMGAGGADAATMGPWAGGDDPNYGMTGSGYGGLAGGGGYGYGGAIGLPEGFSVGTQTGGGQYPLASYSAPGLLQPWTTPFSSPYSHYQSPTGEQVANEPGYAFGRDEGLQALQRSAAAKGTLLTGGTQKDLMRWGNDYATTKYGQADDRMFRNTGYNYGNDLGEYQQAYGIFGNNQANAFNRLSGVAGMGQQAAGMQNPAFNSSGYANAQTDLITGAANANAAGRIGSANAWNQGLSGAANQGLNAYMLYLMGKG